MKRLSAALRVSRSAVGVILLATVAGAVKAGELTYTFTHPLTEVYRSVPGLLDAAVGERISATLSYDPAMAPEQTGSGLRIYTPKVGAQVCQVQVGETSFHLGGYFQLMLYQDKVWWTGEEEVQGDLAVFFAYSDDWLNAPDPTARKSLYLQLMFPRHTFGDTAAIPDEASRWASLRFAAQDERELEASVSVVTDVGPGLQVVPEPATYGLAAGGGLLGLVAMHRFRKRWVAARE